MSVKGASYFNIFECVRNLLDQLDVTYQRAFTESAKPSSVPKGHYEPSSARDRFYDMCADHIVEKNDGIDEEELRKAVAHMKYENEEDHERNIKDMIHDDDYNSPWENKYTTVATGLRTITYSSDLYKTLQREKIQSKRIKRLKIQSKDLTLSPESVIQWMDPPTWTQSSQELVSLDKEYLGLLAG